MSLIAWIYGKAVAFRNHLYDRGILDTFDLGVHTISIGNITTGGTGKTPLVAYVARLLAERGETVCILTRGYKRKNENQRVLVSDRDQILTDPLTSGDEPYELAQKLLGKAIVIADADRVSAAEWARRKFGVTAFVLDDGFQHRRVRRDVDIVCIDATDPFGSGKLLPAGRLRETADGLSRAQIIVITRADLVVDIDDLTCEISAVAPDSTLFKGTNRVTNAETFDHKRVFAFCGIGNPDSFYSQLLKEEVDVAGTMTFADHHFYSQQDVGKLEKAAKKAGAVALVTTAKDAAKVSELEFTMECCVVEIEVEIDDPERFGALI